MSSEETKEVCLDDVIGDLLAEMLEVTPGTEEYEHLSKDLERVYKLKTDEMRAFNDYEIGKSKAEAELETAKKANEVEEKRVKAEKVKNWVCAGTSIASVGATLFLGLKTLKFEETGCVRSKVFPRLFGMTKNT